MKRRVEHPSNPFGINSGDELNISSVHDILLEDVDDGRTVLEADKIGPSQLLEPCVVEVGLWGMYALVLSPVRHIPQTTYILKPFIIDTSIRYPWCSLCSISTRPSPMLHPPCHRLFLRHIPSPFSFSSPSSACPFLAAGRTTSRRHSSHKR